MKILDATCGFKGIWFQKNHPFVTFMDKRKEIVYTRTANSNYKCKGRFEINPDIVSDWRNVPYPDGYFDMVIFDPPHIVIKNGNKKFSGMEMKYGYFKEDEYKSIIRDGLKELFRVLKEEGVFVFKWCESSKKVTDILPLFPYRPLFGSQVGQQGHTYWILFIKHRLEKELEG